jgi:hypothetical protein
MRTRKTGKVIMDPKEQLAELELKVVDKALEKLNQMLKEKQKCNLFGKCENAHIAEMVKMCHQVRSLLGIVPSKA